MKLLVLSDSHGNIDNMCRAAELTQPRHILHLGDCLPDARALRRRCPEIPLTAVPGNCDWGSLDEPERLLEFDGVRLLMLHGHTRNVKSSPLSAQYAAREYGADVLLFGHTHCPLVDYDGTLYTINPGAIGDHLRPTYGVVTIENGHADCAVFVLP